MVIGNQATTTLLALIEDVFRRRTARSVIGRASAANCNSLMTVVTESLDCLVLFSVIAKEPPSERADSGAGFFGHDSGFGCRRRFELSRPPDEVVD